MREMHRTWLWFGIAAAQAPYTDLRRRSPMPRRLNGTIREYRYAALFATRPGDPEIIADLCSRSCYHLFFPDEIEELQLLTPDRSPARQEKPDNSYARLEWRTPTPARDPTPVH